jgi:hypothetical protein
MLVLYIVLVVSTLAVAGVALAIVWRIRRHARRVAAQPDETARIVREHVERKTREQAELKKQDRQP